MTEIITYRLSATGIWQYEFCRDGETVGSVASVVSLREPARIEGRDISWYSRFDMDTDVVPGVSRKVKDNYTGEEVYRIVWWKPDLYEVRTWQKSIQVEIRNGNYLFGVPMMPVTAMTERVSGESRLVRGLEAEKWFRTVFYDPLISLPKFFEVNAAIPFIFCGAVRKIAQNHVNAFVRKHFHDFDAVTPVKSVLH